MEIETENTSVDYFFYDGDLLNSLNLQQQPIYKVSVDLWKIVSPFILLLGTFGNAMTILILFHADQRQFSLSVYMVTMAIFNWIYLYTGQGWRWLMYQFDFNYTLLHDVVCKMNQWLTTVGSDVSSWILVMMTVQRAAAVVWPHRVNVMCTRRKNQIIVIAVVGITMLLQAHLLYGGAVDEMKINNNTVLRECLYFRDLEYAHFYENIWSWVYMCISSLLPFAILLAANIILLFHVVKSTRNARRTVTSEQQLTSREKRTSSMTVILMTMSFAYFIQTAPHAGYVLSLKYMSDVVTKDAEKFALFELVWTVTVILKQSNSAVNFYLYCLTGSRFRNELKKIMLRSVLYTTCRHRVT